MMFKGKSIWFGALIITWAWPITPKYVKPTQGRCRLRHGLPNGCQDDVWQLPNITKSWKIILAEFVGKEAAFLLNYGYQGMVSIIDALVDRNDVIVYDAESHACIVDGVRLHMGKRFVYKHNDIESFEKQLERAQRLAEQTGGGILVITEGVFGMSGAQGKLKEIIAEK
jgi:hypothetical protein